MGGWFKACSGAWDAWTKSKMVRATLKPLDPIEKNFAVSWPLIDAHGMCVWDPASLKKTLLFIVRDFRGIVRDLHPIVRDLHPIVRDLQPVKF